MLIDGISLVDSSVITNTHVESGAAFPTDATQGRMFYLNAESSGNQVGLYVFNGTSWITGDITKIIAGNGLTGGGDSGDITLQIDPAVIAAQAPVQSVNGKTGAVSLSTSDVSEGSNLYYTDARARASISATGSLTYDPASGVMSFTAPSTIDGGTY